MATNWWIKGARVVDPKNQIDKVQDITIRDGVIESLGQAPKSRDDYDVLDAKGLVVAPGLVDLAARLREPGLEHKANINSESKACASAGITTVCMPPDTQPVVDTPAVIELIQKRAEESGRVDVTVLGALTKGLSSEALSEMQALKEAGCVGVSNAFSPVQDTRFLYQALEYASTFDLTVFVHPEDADLAANTCVHQGEVATRLGLPGVPVSSEVIAVSRYLAIAEEIGAKIHFCRLSSAKALSLVNEAKAKGLNVSADVAAHQLHLTEVDVNDFNGLCHVRPVFRTEADKLALRKSIGKDVDIICSDHQPHDHPAKFSPFSSVEPGISSLETLLPLSLHLMHEDGMSLSEVVNALTVAPARLLGIDKGHLSVGAVADVCVFDPDKEWQLTKEGFVSQGQNSPFVGWLLKGQVTHTLLAGNMVFDRR